MFNLIVQCSAFVFFKQIKPEIKPSVLFHEYQLQMK